MCHQLQIITSLPVCAKRAVTYVRHWNNLFLGLSPWRDVMCDMLCMLGEAAVRGLTDCIFKIGAFMDDVISLPRNRAMCHQLQIININGLSIDLISQSYFFINCVFQNLIISKTSYDCI